MSTPADWDKWMVSADSVHALEPEGYDDVDARRRVRDLWCRLTEALSAYEVRPATTELYQDSTGMAGFHVAEKGDSRPLAPALAWILLSHFGDLATVKNCEDPSLLSQASNVLKGFGLKYIPYEYMAGKTYNGKCEALTGFSWANRFFSLIVEFNPEYKP